MGGFLTVFEMTTGVDVHIEMRPVKFPLAFIEFQICRISNTESRILDKDGEIYQNRYMSGLDHLDWLFVMTAFVFQIILIVHFTLRKWRFELISRYGWLVYVLSLAAAGVSVRLLSGGKSWYFWIAGFIYLIWAIFGYTIEYRLQIQWRSPVRWTCLVPYVLLYLAAVMFYWWPLALIWKPLWYVYAIMFVISTDLNFVSHKPVKQPEKNDV